MPTVGRPSQSLGRPAISAVCLPMAPPACRRLRSSAPARPLRWPLLTVRAALLGAGLAPARRPGGAAHSASCWSPFAKPRGPGHRRCLPPRRPARVPQTAIHTAVAASALRSLRLLRGVAASAGTAPASEPSAMRGADHNSHTDSPIAPSAAPPTATGSLGAPFGPIRGVGPEIVVSPPGFPQAPIRHPFQKAPSWGKPSAAARPRGHDDDDSLGKSAFPHSADLVVARFPANSPDALPPQARPASPSPPGATGAAKQRRALPTRGTSLAATSPQGRIAHTPLCGLADRPAASGSGPCRGRLVALRTSPTRPLRAARRNSRGSRWPTACAPLAIGNASLADCGMGLALRKRSILPRITPLPPRCASDQPSRAVAG